jgi:hypothetical protein
MKVQKRRYKPLIFALSFVLASPVMGATYVWRAQVTNTLVDSSFYGGCMAMVTPGPEIQTGNCGAQWVTFSCTGEYNPKDVGNQKFTAAQLSLVMGTSVLLVATDEQTHNGYCFAQRIDNSQN